MKLISTYFSDDQIKTAWVFKLQDEYLVETLDNRIHQEKKYHFSTLDEAEDFAEDSVS